MIQLAHIKKIAWYSSSQVIDDSTAVKILSALAAEFPGCDQETEYISPEVAIAAEVADYSKQLADIQSDLIHVLDLLEQTPAVEKKSAKKSEPAAELAVEPAKEETK